MKTNNLLRVIAAVSLMTVFSCAKEVESEITPEESAEQTVELKTYTMSVVAGKGEIGTRALSLEGNTLSATWDVDEQVSVYNETKSELLSGTLRPQSEGTSTTLKGELSSSKGVDVGDVLTLKFLSPSYSTQEGTLEYIEANCDYATAGVTVTSTEGGDIRTSAASFVNQQAIIKFTMKYPSGEALVNNAFTIKTDGNAISMSLSSSTNVFFVAIPAVNAKEFVINTKDSSTNRHYSYVKSPATFESGKYYEIAVRTSERVVVYNEAELNAAVGYKVPNIMLGCDIPLSAYLKISGNSSQPIALDLHGHRLSRSLGSVDANGHVIEVFAGGNLIIVDGSGNNSGTITGGWANNGGGICNYGTLSFRGGTITGCKATNQGGGIKNNASLEVTGGVISGNSAPDGGGIYNAEGSTLTMTDGLIRSNTASGNGGGIANSGTVSITRANIENNTATVYGGGIWNASSLTLGTFTNITGNVSGDRGGGIFLVNGSSASISDTYIDNNTSSDAGGIFIESGATASISGTGMSGNKSTEHGGGGIVTNGTLTLSGSNTIRDNSCYTNGGGIWNSGTLNVQGDLTVKNNGDEDIFLKGTSKINVTGALTSGANSIGISMEFAGVFTSGYTSSGTSTCPFFSNNINTLKLSGGEYKMTYAYYECSWNGSKVTHTIREIPVDLDFAGDGLLGGISGTEMWLVANGTGLDTDGLSLGDYNCHLILLDKARYTITGTLAVPINKFLDIHCQSYDDKMGKLVVNGGDNNAAIGGWKDYSAGCIFIHGGDITANGGDEGAGIGGGDEGSGFDRLTIYDGNVKATGGDLGAGIGYGDNNCSDSSSDYHGFINIYGGTVTATGGSNGAGIGGGEAVSCGSITIHGGTVTAQGGDFAAGIGYGGCSYLEGLNRVWDDIITINGGTVIAKGGLKGAGIGSGELAYSDLFQLIINDGTVRAYGGDYGAGIGGGLSCPGFDDLQIYGGRVYAYGGIDAAGIGSGELPTGRISDGGKVSIYGGYVYAEGKDWGAGIGAGEDSKGAEVQIYGGTIEAKAGVDAASRGCAFGSENGGNDRGTIVFNETYNNQTTYFKVSVGSSSNSLNPVHFSLRVDGCWSNSYAKVEPCTSHNYSEGFCTWCGASE